MAKCGTEAQDQVHRKRGERCDPCREAANAVARARYARKRELGTTRHQVFAERMAAHKLKVGCASCGYRENADGMEFDHIIPRSQGGDGPTVKSVKSDGNLEALLTHPNIQVLCGTCHNIKSMEERRSG